jgi:hypothetical protein
MAISKSDSNKMRELAQEGKPISKIVNDYFPELDYWEVYLQVQGQGGHSAVGVKRTITNRLNEMVTNPSKPEREAIAKELNDLIWTLYNDHKTNHDKLRKIRGALGE